MGASAFTLDELQELAELAGLTASDVLPDDADRETPLKDDWMRAVEGAAKGWGGKGAISQQDVVRQGLAAGLSNREICERVRTLFPESEIKPDHVSWTIHHERSENTRWWKEHGDRIAELRGVQVEQT